MRATTYQERLVLLRCIRFQGLHWHGFDRLGQTVDSERGVLKPINFSGRKTDKAGNLIFYLRILPLTLEFLMQAFN